MCARLTLQVPNAVLPKDNDHSWRSVIAGWPGVWTLAGLTPTNPRTFLFKSNSKFSFRSGASHP